MEDPTGGMWIYLIFLIIPLARILPRLLRKYRNKSPEPEPDELYSQKGFLQMRECQSRQDLEKMNHQNHNQSLTRKMAGWEKTIFSEKIN